ncbi:RING-like domain-containing protein, partial [Trichophaea hybrida]
YTDFHRSLVQAFLARATMTGDQASEVVAAILTAENPSQPVPKDSITSAILSQHIADINEELSKFDFEIRSMRDQKDRSTIWALVNSNPDIIIQGATHHNADEIAFFRRLLDAMFETNNTLRAEVMAVRVNDAIHLNKNPPKAASEEVPEGMHAISSGGLTMKGAEDALKMFVDEGWLEKSRGNWYTLAPRGLLELNVYLQQTYNDRSATPSDEEEDDEDERPAGEKRIKDCFACKELLTMGQRCEKLTCPVRMHEPCATHYFRVHKDKKCPGCQKTWTGKEPVGEAA